MDGHVSQVAAMRRSDVKAYPGPRGDGIKTRGGHDARNSNAKLSPRALPSISATMQQSQQGTAKQFGTSKNPLALLASESRATAVRINTQENWRSALLEYEVALKELVTNNIDEPPTELRLMKTFQLYDAVTSVVAEQSPELADIMKMFRMEFCRATFTKQGISNFMPFPDTDALEGEVDEIGRTYFDQVGVLLRENAALHVEVNLGNTRDNLAKMKEELVRLTEVNAYYENELNRLERENARSAENYREVKGELDKEYERNVIMMDKFDDEKQKLLQENKDMQLRLCRLRKYLSDRESTVAKDAYKFLKEKKMSVMTRLFDEGDERVSILVMLSQLESRINEELDDYDRETLLCEEADLAERQKRMLNVVSVLLEEMHLCEENYLRLVPHAGSLVGEERDETDGYVSLLCDERLYETLVSRAEEREKQRVATATESDIVDNTELTQTAMTYSTPEHLPSISEPTINDFSTQSILREMKDFMLPQPVPGGTNSTMQLPASEIHEKKETKEDDKTTEEGRKNEGEEADTGKREGARRSLWLLAVKPREANVESLRIVKKKQEEWVSNIFGTAVETTNLLKRVRDYSACEGSVTDKELLMRYFISKPMLDVSNNKFQIGIDIFTGPGPQTQSFLCSVMDMDPVESLHVPQGTNYMQVKYRNPLRVEAVKEDKEEAEAVVPNPETVGEWGGKTVYAREETEPEVPELANSSQFFSELKKTSIMKAAAAGVTVASSTTPAAATFERLNPLSPNRSPEWLLYQNMFGGYRPLTPRLIDISYIDHILLNSCERHFERCEERYMRCLKQARGRATNSQMALNMAERFFKDLYALTDFQESIIHELESRYCYPELVAKSLYEILCFLDAMVATQPLIDLYLSCIRGFESPTRIHYITYVLYQISVNWPSSNPSEAVLKEDVATLLEFIYKKAPGIASMDASEILVEYRMATRAAPITLNSLRHYLVTAMLHFEDPLLLSFNGLLSYKATSSAVVEMNYEQFESALSSRWEEKVEGKLLIRYLAASCGFNKKTELTTKELACVAASMWSSQLWMNM